MDTKLTLSLNKQVIERAKIYAKEKQVSLSALVENYLQKLTAEYPAIPETKSSLVEELSGIVSLPADNDYREDFGNHLVEKRYPPPSQNLT